MKSSVEEDEGRENNAPLETETQKCSQVRFEDLQAALAQFAEIASDLRR